MGSQVVSLPVPNLVSGVSQQPPTLRVTSSAQDMVNGWPSVIAGLNKRPRTEHLAALGIVGTDDCAAYLIDRDSNYEYIVVIAQGDLKVYNLKGEQQPVRFPSGKSYLQQSARPSTDFRFMTMGDTTFVLNRNVVVQDNDFGENGAVGFPFDGEVYTQADLPVDPLVGKIYHVSATDQYFRGYTVPATPDQVGWTAISGLFPTPQDGSPVVTGLPLYGALGYKVWLRYDNVTQGTRYAQYQVSTVAPGIPEHNEWQLVRLSDLVADLNNRRLNPVGRYTIYVKQAIANINYSIYVNNVRVATYLTPNGVDANNAVPGTDTIAATLATRMGRNFGTATSVIGSTIVVAGCPVDATITVTSSSGDKVMSCYYDTVASFSDLPPNEIVGRIIRVKGDKKNQQDDYFVRFNKNSLWDESYAYNQGGSLVNVTMPHALIRGSNGVWTFGNMSWAPRRSGDTESNPDPSFVDNRISDLFLWQSRLGFLSGENVCLSVTGELQSFYRTTNQTLVDSDPVDMAVLSPNVDQLRHAVPFNEDVLLFSDRSQFRLSFANYVSPKTCKVAFTTAFACANGVKPVNTGASVYFADDSPKYSYLKVWEYFPKGEQGGDDAMNVTDAVPQYIRNGIQWMTSNSRVQALMVSTTLDPSSAYLYKYYWSDNKKLQNAWSRWDFPDMEKVVWGGISQERLYLIAKRNGELFLEVMYINEEAFGFRTGKSKALLDRRVDKTRLTFAYDTVQQETTITLPYVTTGSIQIVHEPSETERYWPSVRQISNNTVIVKGDIRSSPSIIAGLSYTFSYTFSHPYVRIARAGGGDVVASDGRLQMRYLQLEYHDTSVFSVRLDTPGRDPAWTHVDAKIADKPGVNFNATTVGAGFARIPIMAKNTDANVTILNDTPYSSAFGGAEWTALYTPKTRRMG